MEDYGASTGACLVAFGLEWRLGLAPLIALDWQASCCCVSCNDHRVLVGGAPLPLVEGERNRLVVTVARVLAAQFSKLVCIMESRR